MTDRVAQFITAQTNAHIKYERNIKVYRDKFDYKLWNTDKKATDLSKYNQFEVLFPPGVLKVTNVKKNMYKPNSNFQDKYKNANNVDTLKNYKLTS